MIRNGYYSPRGGVIPVEYKVLLHTYSLCNYIYLQVDDETVGGEVEYCQDLMQEEMGVKTAIPRFITKQVRFMGRIIGRKLISYPQSNIGYLPALE